MPEIIANGKTILWNHGRPALTKDQMFRLWRAAIKDDGKFCDEILKKVHDDMIAFDSERSEIVIDLMVKRHTTAGCALRTLLNDMQDFSSPTFPPPPVLSPARLDS
jgi:hypothetical protein